MDYATVLRHIRRSDAEVHSVFRCGSHVYGTAGAASDEDFVVVFEDARATKDLLFRAGANFVIHGVESFRAVCAHAIDAPITLAVETLNRFESHYLNTAADALRFVEAVGLPVTVMYCRRAR